MILDWQQVLCLQFSFFGNSLTLLLLLGYLMMNIKKQDLRCFLGAKKNTYPAVISISTSVCMTLISVVPFFWSYTDLTLSIYAFILILILGVWFTNKSFNLHKETTDESAKKLMLASFAYLPLMQIIYVLDKFFL